MKTLCFIAIISLAISTTVAESNLRKENQVRLTQGFNFPIDPKGFNFPIDGKGLDFPFDGKGAEPVAIEVYMEPVSMYYYIKNQFDHYEFECVKPALFAMYLKEQYKAYKEMSHGAIEQIIMKYTKRADGCFYQDEFLEAYNGLHLGGV